MKQPKLYIAKLNYSTFLQLRKRDTILQLTFIRDFATQKTLSEWRDTIGVKNRRLLNLKFIPA